MKRVDLKTPAKSSIESDPSQLSIKSQRARDEGTYGALDEEDPKEPEQDETPEEEKDQEEPDAEEVLGVEVSLDSISDAIKQLRSGRSVDDSQIKMQLRTYFDRLDETERTALLTFLKAFSGILTGGTTGQDAADPSDPPTLITMKMSGNEDPEPEVKIPRDEEEEDEEEEDIKAEPADQPPIKAGGQQALQEIRKKVRKLMMLN